VKLGVDRNSLRMQPDDNRSALFLAATMMRHRIRVPTGNKVLVEITPYDLNRGRIINRAKLNNPAVQRDIQPGDTGGKLGDVGVISFVSHGLIATTARHV
jgi:translation initiation factor IF-1